MNATQRHIANEWADMATIGIQWLRNVQEGISTCEEALTAMEFNLQRIQALIKGSTRVPVMHFRRGRDGRRCHPGKHGGHVTGHLPAVTCKTCLNLVLGKVLPPAKVIA